MNRRSFLKSAALATVAVPVVGLPATWLVIKPDKFKVLGTAKPVWWTVRYSCHAPSLGLGTGTYITDCDKDLSAFLKNVIKWGYRDVKLYMNDIYIGHL